MATQMPKRIELELRGRDAGEIVELNLDNCKTENGQISGLDDKFAKLEILSMINCELTTLKDFPKLPSLKKLELSDNRLVGGLEHLAGCPEITHLNMSGNLFKDAKALAPLKDLKSLMSLDLFSCPVTEGDNYRTEVFGLLPQLTYLDGFDRNDKEIEESDADGLDEDDLGDAEEDDVDPDEDEDEGEDFDPGVTGNGHAEDDDDLDDEEEEDFNETEDSNTQESSDVRQARKRKHEDTGDDESSQDG